MTPRLMLNRLAVMRRGRALYDQRYHSGVNIIHGDNGSGKSTIADFIFFVLGGDLREWKPHAELAEFVLAEVLAGDTVLTLRRDVSKDGGRPMQVFFGPMDQALASGPTAWELLPYKRPDKGYSFSQVLFRAMGIPEAVADGSSNITMHQVLRLLYSDQMSPIQRIFRAENFDTWQTRQAVGELLCGIGGYDLYAKQIEEREVKREYDDAVARYRNLTTIAAGYGDRILPENIQAAIDNMVRERDRLLAQLATVMEVEDVPREELDEAERLRKGAVREFSQAKRAVAELEDRIEALEYEIEDAAQFITHIERSLSDFDDAAATFFSLGHVRFEFCPSCFGPTREAASPHHCHLCGAEVSKEEADSKALAVRLDLEMQLRESRLLQEDREATLRHLKADLRIEKTRLKRAANANELARRGALSGREATLAELSRKVGFLDSEIEVLQKRLELGKEIVRLGEYKEELNSKLTRLRNSIEAIIAGQARRKQVAYTRVSDNTKRLLDNDLSEHSDFGQVDHVTFDFSGDWIAINNDKNRFGSASGMVVLKNSFFMGLFLSSLQDQQFNLPRFMLFDNIEDKGMVAERSWNCQRLIIQETAKYKSNHQIIFTTSKIAPELAESEYVVGRKYTRKQPSLEFIAGD